MHRKLERQIKRYLGERAAISPEWRAFLGSISRAYAYFDKDSKNLNERLAKFEDVRKATTNFLEDFEEERKKLAKAKAKDDALLESIGEGVVAIDQEGKVIIVNRVAENLLGFTSKEMLGKSFFRLVSMEDEQGRHVFDSQRPIALAMFSSKTTITAACFIVRKDGTKFPAAVTATPVFLGAELIGAVSVFRDITREKEIEKLRMDFLSLASHQLRTPLSGTKWLIDTMRNGLLGPMNQRQKEYLYYIYQINERMIKLVSEMLNVLMLESGVAVIKKEEISVSKLFEELFLMTGPAAQNKRITLRNAFKDQKALFVQSDFQALRNILEIFVSNAINYSQNGQEVISDAKEESAAVIFSVKDSGIGIPKEEQKMISERFYRASNAKEFKPNGTGLGLYIAFLLASKIGGKISFESEKDKGATFYLRVPKKVDSGSNFDNNQTKIKI